MDNIEKRLRKLLDDCQPRSLTLIDTANTRLLEDYLNDHPHIQSQTVHTNLMQCLPTLPRSDLTIILNTIPSLKEEDAAALIAKVRDVLSKRFYVWLSAESLESTPGWPQQLVSLGMNLVGDYGADGQLFKYEIFDYKTVPEWLNSKYWANPQFWDKSRW